MNTGTDIGFSYRDKQNKDGTLAGIEVQRQLRTNRLGSIGQVTKYGDWKNDGTPMLIPADKLTDVISQLVGTMCSYADGRTAQHQARMRRGNERDAFKAMIDNANAMQKETV